jgi:DNA mismatch repair protein MutS
MSGWIVLQFNLELYHSYNPWLPARCDRYKTLSPMGGRLLKRWLALPLKEANKIRNRHQVVS